MKVKFLILMGFSGALISLDQLTKMLIYTQYALGESTTVIHNFFNITYVRNFGAAFGFLANAPEGFREIFFLSIPPIALILIIVMLRGVKDNDYLQITALSSVFGGAIGNYIDRIRFGYVVDFLDFHWMHKISWPAFNVADMAIVGGVLVLFYLWMLEEYFNKNGDPAGGSKEKSKSESKKASA